MPLTGKPIESGRVDLAPDVTYDFSPARPFRETPDQVQKAFGIRRSLMLLSLPSLFEPRWLTECVALGIPRFKHEHMKSTVGGSPCST